MAEEVRTIRLNKVAKEFNVGISSLVEFLIKKNYQIENSPNAKISDEMYELLAKEFQSERKVKEDAQKIDISIAKEPVTIKASSNIEKEEPVAIEPEKEEIVIKDNSVHAPEKPKAEKPKKEVVEEKKEELVEEPVKEVKEETFEPQVISLDRPEEDDSAIKFNVKVVNKIDLDSINTKSRPDKKTKEEKEIERKEKRKKEKEEKKKPATVSKEVKKPVVVKEPEKPIEPATQPEQPKEIEFIETQYQKLDGPKIVSKIDLSVFEKPKQKPVASSSEKPKTETDADKKKKRKRIKKDVVKNDNQKPQQQGQGKPGEKKWNKGAKKPEIKKAEPTQEEIEKQIKETLARLSPTGKSKASKHRREKRHNIQQQIQEEQTRLEDAQKILKVTEFVTANELATMMDIPVNQVIATCMTVGIFVSINQRLAAESIQFIADEFGYKVDFVSSEVVDAISEIEEEDNPEDLVSRPPVVTVMGHVDHGKTSLLDYIRKANVIAGEAGGITQHIGAYEVQTKDGKKITFLDTPGHEAFTAMRARGAKITDMAIIVIAADDKIMPQTIEAINHAQAANVPIVFAINKIDKPGANPDKIKEELAAMNLLIEEWGGKYQSQDISAKAGINIEELLEKVLLEAEMLELKGNPKKRAKGAVIESSLDKGRGYVAKILIQDGSMKMSDIVLAGSTFGRVKAMYNERNQRIEYAGPSTPVLLLGLDGAPQAGDTFNVMETEKEAKNIATKRTQLQREQGIRTQKHITLDEIGRRIAIGDFKQLNLIVKADVDGSAEALSDSLLKLSTDEVQVNVVHKAVGQITESDVLLATASNAIIIGFQVRPSVSARKMAEAEQIDIRLYSIIYSAINEIKDAIEGMLSPEIQEKITANLEVREVFKITKVGTIAGCFCLDGKINRNTKVRLIRDGIVVYTGKLASLKRFKDDVKEVVSGQDCGLQIENFNDLKVGDIVEGYEETEIKRKL